MFSTGELQIYLCEPHNAVLGASLELHTLANEMLEFAQDGGDALLQVAPCLVASMTIFLRLQVESLGFSLARRWYRLLISSTWVRLLWTCRLKASNFFGSSLVTV